MPIKDACTLLYEIHIQSVVEIQTTLLNYLNHQAFFAAQSLAKE
jgi:hypothetical protein